MLKVIESYSAKNKAPRGYRLFTFIAITYAILFFVSNIAANKPVELFSGIVVPGGTLLFSFMFIFSNGIAEVYGAKRNRNTVLWISLSGLIGAVYLWIIVNINHIGLHSPIWFQNDSQWKLVLGDKMLTMLASTLSFAISENINGFCIQALKNKYPLNIRARFLTSTAIGAFFDGVVFLPIVFWGLGSSKIIEMGVSMFLFKVGIETIFIWFSPYIINWLKDYEDIDESDISDEVTLSDLYSGNYSKRKGKSFSSLNVVFSLVLLACVISFACLYIYFH
jgi:uncharacterized integral membrane protein (TIGR00697 family)